VKPKHTSHLDEDIDNEAILSIQPSRDKEDQVQYRVVPLDADMHRDFGEGGKAWRVVIGPVGVTGRPMPLEIRGDVVIGSNRDPNVNVDVNIFEWKGYHYGVSRRHVMLRPSRNKLYIMDLRSTNGTHVNGLPLGVGWAYALKDGDLLTLGRLHVRVRITQQP
jgi:hypothetical protein